jgi:hypothetical protein
MLVASLRIGLRLCQNGDGETVHENSEAALSISNA